MSEPDDEAEQQADKPATKGNSSDAQKNARAIFLGAVGLLFTAAQVWLTYAKNDFDRESKKFDVIVSLFQKCSSDQSGDRNFVNRFIGTQKVFSIEEINHYFADDSFHRALTTCSTIVSNAAATASVTNQEEQVTPPANLPKSASTGESTAPRSSAGPSTPSSPPNDGPRFWIYLGTYKDGAWKTRYVDIPDGFDPVKFDPTTDGNKGEYKVREQTGALNLRYGVFSLTGDFPPISKTLQPNQQVKLRSTAQWFDSGNWWATIEPPK